MSINPVITHQLLVRMNWNNVCQKQSNRFVIDSELGSALGVSNMERWIKVFKSYDHRSCVENSIYQGDINTVGLIEQYLQIQKHSRIMKIKKREIPSKYASVEGNRNEYKKQILLFLCRRMDEGHSVTTWGNLCDRFNLLHITFWERDIVYHSFFELVSAGAIKEKTRRSSFGDDGSYEVCPMVYLRHTVSVGRS